MLCVSLHGPIEGVFPAFTMQCVMKKRLQQKPATLLRYKTSKMINGWIDRIYHLII